MPTHCGGLLRPHEDTAGQSDVRGEYASESADEADLADPNDDPRLKRQPSRRSRRARPGGSCKKRTCEICGLVWAKDWRRVLFEALKSLGVPVALSAVTPPGMDQLPWDERHCAHLAPHKHGKSHGCRVDDDALAEWSFDGRSAGSGCITRHATQRSERWGAAFPWPRERGSRRHEGRDTSIPYSHSTLPAMCVSSTATWRTWLGSLQNTISVSSGRSGE